MNDLSRMTFKELRQYARDAGYSSITRLPTKKRLIVAIMAQRTKESARQVVRI